MVRVKWGGRAPCGRKVCRRYRIPRSEVTERRVGVCQGREYREIGKRGRGKRERRWKLMRTEDLPRVKGPG